MAYLDRQRASKLMTQADLDGLIFFSTESFEYATGASSGVATMWRKAGAVAVFVPADPNIPETAVVSDLFAQSFKKASHITDVRENPIWVESSNLIDYDLNEPLELIIKSSWQNAERSKGFARPTTFEPSICFQHLSDAINDCGLRQTNIGFEASAVSIREFTSLKDNLSIVNLIDATDVIDRLKMVKSPAEIQNLRLAVEIAESGICAVRDAIMPETTRDELSTVWSDTIYKHPKSDHLSGAWEYISVGPNPWNNGRTAKSGDLIKVDVGCLINGYTSDSARTFVLGHSSNIQNQIFEALLSGFNAGAKMLHPGVPLSEVHRLTQAAIRNSGFPDYTRGHFGHGLGAGLGSEEWPFISANATSVFEPGMVIAFECPWYIEGIGGLIIENQVLITEAGHEMMNTLPLGLVSIEI